MAWLRSLDAVNLIQGFRQGAEQARDEVLARAQHQLETGRPAEEVLGFLAHTLTNKLLHTPSVRMRQAGREGNVQLLDAANDLFQLSSDTKATPEAKQ